MSDCDDALRGTAACDGCQGCDPPVRESSSLARHRGWFEVSEDLVYSRDRLVSMIFGSVRVYCAEKDEFRGTIRYVGVSPLFDALDFGEVIPEYQIEVSDSGITAKRID